MKVYRISIDGATIIGSDDTNKDLIADEIAYRLNISSSDVYVEELVEQKDAEE